MKIILEMLTLQKQITSILSIICVFFISYLPLSYFFKSLQQPNIKQTVFLLLIVLNILVIFLQKRIKSRNEWTIFSLYLLFPVYSLLSYGFAGDALDTTSVIRNIAFINPLFALFSLSCRDNKNKILLILYAVSFVYTIFLAIALINGTLSLSSNSFQSIFYQSSQINENNYGYQNTNMYLGINNLSGLYLVLSSKRRILKLVAIMSVILTVFGMLLTGGRSSLVSLLVVFSILLIRYFAKLLYSLRRIKKALIILFFIIFLIFFLNIIVIPLLPTDLTVNLPTIQRLLILSDTESDSSMRLLLFSTAWNLFIENAFSVLFGGGINSFSAYMGYYDAKQIMYPHNIILELLCEYGIIGFIFFFTPVLYILRARKKFEKVFGLSLEEKFIFFIFFFILMNHMTTGSLGASWILVYFSALLVPSKSLRLHHGTNSRDGI
ncbi:O-antigen ligase family protein [Sphaerospermopsis sp. LEGE 00249]|uniref:O-antigen ligase family protein n=1 Tax=Sphaerospermopsis sp. LEGE 00249 TaxID=1380707 RepID=UPI00164EA435|nr:O-antigen ligase family protein [Sphaerospermopsis sp. LEGE 00249]MBC5797036.1 O-antigen ligase family protein [Sphaerospermopsis sp. LEGE 00249]